VGYIIDRFVGSFGGSRHYWLACDWLYLFKI